MIEAMARALPCVGSDVGGIPELIDTHCIVPRGDHSALTAKFVEMLSNPGLLEQASQANLLRATDYRESSLDGKRTEFLLHLRAATQNWLAKGRSN
jgi:glycosyltransferase involved in cell wall biosynthesis